MNSGSALLGENIFSLMKKYDKAGPRYTSYPTAPMFAADFGPENYREEIVRSNGKNNSTDLSLYFHIPFCDTLCYFCGCTTVISKNRDRIKEYIGYLKREIEMLASEISNTRKVVQMHWGGGTPTYLTPSEISDLTKHIKNRFNFSENAEVSVEMDPRDLSFEHIQALSANGFNRVSMGVQDFNPDVLAAINRDQGEELTRKVIEWTRTLGFKSLNLDLVYGLPLQTVESFESTLDKIIAVSPERIAVYNFAYVPWMKPHQKLINPDDLPSPEIKLELLTMTIKKFTSNGYVYIGMDHFAKENDELTIAQKSKTLQRNFQGYSTNAGCDLFGMGMSSISHFTTNYAQNAKTLTEYYHAIDHNRFATEVGYRMSFDDQLRKYVILRLMCDLTLNFHDVENKFNIKFDEYFSESLPKLNPFIEDNLLERKAGELLVTMQGRLFLRNIAMCFDAYLNNVSKDKPVFSRTI
ncbi:MAG: oxygen-independent coproporphyrinogen III oxidase [Ignavibacteriales bacterium]|nr:oxygen-independent coproporphyrinogen III oxidase [Ignavibacteriales bacterium]